MYKKEMDGVYLDNFFSLNNVYKGFLPQIEKFILITCGYY